MMAKLVTTFFATIQFTFKYFKLFKIFYFKIYFVAMQVIEVYEHILIVYGV